MSRLSIFAVAAVLSTLAVASTTEIAFAKEHHHVRKAPQYISTVPGWAYAGPRASVHYDDTPSYNDPSKFGGDSALPVTR